MAAVDFHHDNCLAAPKAGKQAHRNKSPGLKVWCDVLLNLHERKGTLYRVLQEQDAEDLVRFQRARQTLNYPVLI